MKHYSLILFFSLILATSVRGQQASSSVWLEVIKNRPQEFLRILTEEAPYPWPAIHSKDLVATMTSQQQPEFNARIELARHLIASLKNIFTVPTKSFDSMKTEVRLANEAARKIREARGYVNLLLSDIIHRGALFKRKRHARLPMKLLASYRR